jgi:hypothetical protein
VQENFFFDEQARFAQRTEPSRRGRKKVFHAMKLVAEKKVFYPIREKAFLR